MWFVKLDDDSPDYILNIVAEDKTLILSHHKFCINVEVTKKDNVSRETLSVLTAPNHVH